MEGLENWELLRRNGGGSFPMPSSFELFPATNASNFCSELVEEPGRKTKRKRRRKRGLHASMVSEGPACFPHPVCKAINNQGV